MQYNLDFEWDQYEANGHLHRFQNKTMIAALGSHMGIAWEKQCVALNPHLYIGRAIAFIWLSTATASLGLSQMMLKAPTRCPYRPETEYVRWFRFIDYNRSCCDKFTKEYGSSASWMNWSWHVKCEPQKQHLPHSSCMRRYHVCLVTFYPRNWYKICHEAFDRACSHICPRSFDWGAHSHVLHLSIAVCFTWFVLPICIVPSPMHVLLAMHRNFPSLNFLPAIVILSVV